ncbi:MAG: DUF2953 domain-containing protein [Oscillospiraceae bacterium]|nr:DUF2953 domain-containing protein [Oscillospiraceae bacterium]
MAGWIILGVIVLIVFCINRIRIGADVAYENGAFSLSAKVAGIRLQLLPKEDQGEEKPGKEKKPRKKKKKKEKNEASEETKDEKPAKKGLPLGMNLSELLDLVKAVLGHLARFPRKFLIDHFKLHVLMAGADPYDTAMSYAYLNEALSVLLPLARKGFKVKRSDVRTDVDFTQDAIRLDFAMGLTIRIGQIFGLVNSILFAAVKALVKSKIRQRRERKEEKKNNPDAPEALPADEAEHSGETGTEEHDKDIKSEERTDSHG